MKNNEFLNDFVRIGIDFSQENLEQVKIFSIRSNKEKVGLEIQNGSTAYNDEILLTIIYFFVFAVSLIFIKSFNSYQTRNNQISAFKYSNQIPCKFCRFFTHNYYLKCAVNPHIALKVEAINCPDYYPRHTR